MTTENAMDSREKKDLFDEFGIGAGAPPVDTQADQPAQPPITCGEDGIPVEELEFDPAVVEDSEETTVTDGIPVDVIHEPIPEPKVPSIAGIGDDPVSIELADTRDRLLRLAAEFENFKKRRIREREEQQKYANERLLKDFLPVIDNLERALDSARQTGQGQAITAGLDLVIHEFLNVMAREGVTPLQSIGKPFDPSFQDALQQIETSDVQPGMVAAEILKGYLLNGRVLRPALVVVAREPQGQA